jgi:two-component system chemotaxis response regulator CheB
MAEQIRNLIVIGASAGGIKAITKILEGLSQSINAAVMVVLHVSRKSNIGNISEIFQRSTSLECVVATNNLLLEKGKIYLASPEHHLLVNGPVMLVNQGPEENRFRPSIDVLFRSAAVHYGNKVIGIVITGMLEDGTSGMFAIKTCGGLCIVQDPSEAEYSSMPLNVMRKIQVDYMAPLDEIPIIIQNILNNPLPPKIAIPEELKVEAELTEKLMSDINKLKKIADRSDFVCPDCGGGLWSIKNDPTHRYRCHTGHVYTEKLLQDLQDLKIEETIWVSIRMLEEKRSMLRMLISRKSRGEGNETDSVFTLEKRAQDIDEHIIRLKSLVVKLADDSAKDNQSA